jgi:hypothetical protein
MGWYGKGFDEAEAQVAANSQSFTREFFFKAGEDVTFRMIDDEPINIRDHFIMGKGWFTCIQGINDEQCPLCEAGNKATNHFVFNVFDPREYTKKTGEKVTGGQAKLWRIGITLLRMLDKKRAKYGPLSSLAIEISKMGQGQSTAYNIEVEKAAKAVKLPEGQEVYDRLEVLAPKSRKELIAIMNGANTPATAPDEDEDDDDGEDDIDWKKS